MAKLKLVGIYFGIDNKNLVLEETEKREGGSVVYKCLCNNCKNEEWLLSARRIKFDNPISCGCLNNLSIGNGSATHRMTRNSNGKNDKFYNHWTKMKSRCFGKDKEHFRYIEKQIKIEDTWLNFETFLQDMYEEYINHVSIFGEKNTTLDRINTNKNYCKENCRWATSSIQLYNRDYSKSSVNNPILATRISDGYNIITYNARMFALRIFNTHKHHIINICKSASGRNLEKGWTFKYIDKIEWDNFYNKNIDFIISLEDFKLTIPYYFVEVNDKTY